VELGVHWLALGGGEPTEWEHLGDVIRFAQGHNLGVTVTTANLDWRPAPDALPSRVHISCDPMHSIGLGQAQRMAHFLREQGVFEVGLNVIVHDPGFVEQVLKDRQELDVVLLLPKPVQFDGAWLETMRSILLRNSVPGVFPGRVLVDGCLGRLLDLVRAKTGRCMQGRTSMALDQFGRASVCSNIGADVRTESLVDAWERVRLSGDDPAAGCLVPRL
jgi:MoaA/NifB/PqqE/SkfB family radical SAM enzyme